MNTQKLKNDLAVMRILGTSEMRYNIGLTKERAFFELVIDSKEKKYQFYKDSVPLPEEENDAMLKIYNII